MTKKQVIWLLLRLAGLWFLWQALITSLNLVWMGTVMTMSEAPNTGALLLQSAAFVIGYGVLGVYCLLGGKILFHFLNREDNDHGDSDSDSSSLGLTG
jgi:hypothetical protein